MAVSTTGYTSRSPPETQPLNHHMNCSHAPITGGSSLVTQLVMNVAALHHRLGLILPGAWRQSFFNSALAVAQDLRVASAHSKCRFHRLLGCLNNPISTYVYRHFELFRLTSSIKSRLLKA